MARINYAGLALGLIALLSSPASASAGDIAGTKVRIFAGTSSVDGNTKVFVAMRATVEDSRRLVVTQEGDNIVISSFDDPFGVIPEASAPGQAACTGVRNRSRVVCPAAGVQALNFSMPGSDDVVDASAVPFNLEGAAGGGDDTIIGGNAPNNLVDAGPGSDSVIGGPAKDTLANFESGGDAGNDTLIGNGGPDNLFSSPGSDLVDGGAGTDTFFGYAGTSPATITLGDGLCNDGTAADRAVAGEPVPQGCAANGVARDLLRDLELVGGSDGDDDITGSSADERIDGKAGNDVIEGAGGVDILLGKGGDDTLFGRDGITDSAMQCGEPGTGTLLDRTVVDPDDPVDPTCTRIERGAFATPGPVGTPPAENPPDVPGPPAEFQPQPTPVTTGVATTGTEGSGPDGGDGGNTPPELEITSPGATVRSGVAELRVRCVYLAQACVGELRLSARKSVAAKNGRKKISVKKGDLLGTADLEIPWGTSKPVEVRISRDLKKLFAAGVKTVPAIAEVRARDGAAGGDAAEARVKRNVKLGAGAR